MTLTFVSFLFDTWVSQGDNAMSYSFRSLGWLVLSVIAVCLNVSPASAQLQLPSSPTPIETPDTPIAPPSGPPSPLSPAPLPLLTPPPPSTWIPPSDSGPSPVGHDPLLDGPLASGWFVDAEVDIVQPRLQSRLSADVSYGIYGSDTVSLPTTPFDWTAAPRLDLGYHLPDRCGDIVFSYRLLLSEAQATIIDYDYLGDGWMRNHLDLQVFDLDYASPDLVLNSRWGMKGRVGVRLTNLFFDSQAVGDALEQRITDHFIGAGPHMGLDFWRQFDTPGLSLFVRLDGGVVIGRVHQAYDESWALLDLGSATSLSGTQAVPNLNVQVGLKWVPSSVRGLSFSIGYEFESWWSVGRVGDCRADLYDQGLFLQSEFKF